ncbi:hypothetical protein HK099_004090 [Clydaea vesicula]|uniref:Uncharacterized protein n=1 Tax=Clydaea vesicula TaxID=447962 RepID=A0AAD5Y0G9_9FUNG|nr:hypothetical protein HK099_004090 [Clydaea vesicula]KAJ3383683.1 hypothetical protein HDU92_004025 [Lobulomyces angularis]
MKLLNFFQLCFLFGVLSLALSELSPNLIINGDAEAGVANWKWNSSSENFLSSTSYTGINITRGIILNDKNRLHLGQGCFQAKYGKIDSFVSKIFSATQTLAIPENLKRSTATGQSTFKFSSSFIRFFFTNDYVKVSLSFTDANNQKIKFQYQNALTLQYENGIVDTIGGNIKPFPGNSTSQAYFFSEISNGTVPSNAVNIVIEMEFSFLDAEKSLVSKAFVDNIALVFYFNKDTAKVGFLQRADISITGWIGIGVGSLGLFLLFVMVPIFTCFKKKSSPMLKKFTLKRRNSRDTQKRPPNPQISHHNLVQKSKNRLSNFMSTRHPQSFPYPAHSNPSNNSATSVNSSKVLLSHSPQQNQFTQFLQNVQPSPHIHSQHPYAPVSAPMYSQNLVHQQHTVQGQQNTNPINKQQPPINLTQLSQQQRYPLSHVRPSSIQHQRGVIGSKSLFNQSNNSSIPGMSSSGSLSNSSHLSNDHRVYEN